MTRSQLVVYLARLFSFVREAQTPNTGQRVEGIQKWSGGVAGDSWCAHFATMVLDIAFQGKSPIPRTGSCDEIMRLAKERGWLTNVAGKGDLFLYVKDGTDAHHVGIVTETWPVGLRGIAGNTSADGKSSNGTGVFEHEIVASVFVRYPRDE